MQPETSGQLIELDARRRTTVRAGHHSMYVVTEEPDGTLIWRPASIITEDERALLEAPWLVDRVRKNRTRGTRNTRTLPD